MLIVIIMILPCISSPRKESIKKINKKNKFYFFFFIKIIQLKTKV